MEEILKKINEKKPENKPISNLNIAKSVYRLLQKEYDLKNQEETIKKLEDEYKNINTLKTYIKHLISWSSINEINNESYRKKFENLNNTKEEKEELKIFISRKKIQETIKKTKKMLKEKYDLDIHMRFVVLNLYYLIPPLRNDFANCEIHEKPVQMEEDKNYIFLKKKQLILNEYKTAKAYGQKIIELPNPLIKILREYLKKRGFPEDKHELFYKKDFKPFTYLDLTLLLNRSFFGEKISSTVLRKSYISEKYPNRTEEQEQDADIMGHSINTQQSHYCKKI